jgi:hypothetical protein
MGLPNGMPNSQEVLFLGMQLPALQNPQKPKGPGDLQNMKKNYFNSPLRSKTINKKKFSFLNP